MNPNKTILLVDDDACFRFAMATELRASGFIVLSAEDGDRGFRMMENNDGHPKAIDLIITDLAMPRRDGFRLSTDLRNSNHVTPILVITGHLSEEMERELRTLGRIEFLEKPFTPGELLSRVEGMISGNTVPS